MALLGVYLPELRCLKWEKKREQSQGEEAEMYSKIKDPWTYLPRNTGSPIAVLLADIHVVLS